MEEKLVKIGCNAIYDVTVLRSLDFIDHMQLISELENAYNGNEKLALKMLELLERHSCLISKRIEGTLHYALSKEALEMVRATRFGLQTL